MNDYVLTTSDIQNGRIYSVLLNIDEERMIEVDYVVEDDLLAESGTDSSGSDSVSN